MASITANTSTIRNTANDIVNNAKAYKGAFDAMYTQIRALRSTWTSEDGNAYIAKIESFYEDFTSMYKALITAANALEKDAANYEKTVRDNMA